jgi:phosphopentomutase
VVVLDLRRVILIVLDSVGAGAMPDADRYGDKGADTLGGIARAMGGLSLPNLERMGLGNLHQVKGVNPVEKPTAYYARMGELSEGKDTTTGHWEIAGIITEKGFPTYPHGFPKELIADYEKAIAVGTLGNYPASGTEIIAQLGEEHVKTGKPIVYTSADSVFQVACHEDIFPLEKLYGICEVARKLLTGEHAVSRVIARPFIGSPGAFKRTEHRKDFSLVPPSDTFLDVAKKAGLRVTGIGKIEDIFVHRGLTDSTHTGNNKDSCECLLFKMSSHNERGLFFVNLVDFDMLFGHRNNVEGYAQSLREFDAFLPKILEIMMNGDLLIITADHGCDPTFPGTDHTREYVPLLVYSKDFAAGGSIEPRHSFADITATMMELFHLEGTLAGTSFASMLK